MPIPKMIMNNKKISDNERVKKNGNNFKTFY